MFLQDYKKSVLYDAFVINVHKIRGENQKKTDQPYHIIYDLMELKAQYKHLDEKKEEKKTQYTNTKTYKLTYIWKYFKSLFFPFFFGK